MPKSKATIGHLLPERLPATIGFGSAVIATEPLQEQRSYVLLGGGVVEITEDDHAVLSATGEQWVPANR